MRTGALVAIALLAGCSAATVVEPDPIPADYTEWYRVDATGAVPGHGDSYRIIYANDTATEFSGTGTYDADSIIVKEVHARNGDQPGDLSYLAVMRKLTSPPDGGELQGEQADGSGGWLFTYLADSIESEEENRLSCWEDCHGAAPLDSAFLSYEQ